MINYLKRKKFDIVENTPIPSAVISKFRQLNSQYSDEDVKKIVGALKDYFKMCILDEKKIIYMPSKCVDDLWHQFILFTQEYSNYCQKVFRKYLHHYPSITKTDQNFSGNDAYVLAKMLDQLLDRKHEHPLLFTIDIELSVQDAPRYDLKRMSHHKTPFRQPSRSALTSNSGGGKHRHTPSDAPSFSGSFSGSASGCSDGGGGCGGGC